MPKVASGLLAKAPKLLPMIAPMEKDRSPVQPACVAMSEKSPLSWTPVETVHQTRDFVIL